MLLHGLDRPSRPKKVQRIALAATLALTTGLLGCQGDDITAPPGADTFTLTSAAGWAGGTLTVRSAAFRQSTGTAVLRVAGTAVPLARIDDTTMTATLPPGLAGQGLATAVELGGTSHTLPAVTVFGFSETVNYPLTSLQDVYPTSLGGHAAVIGGELLGARGITRIDLDTKQVSTVSAVSNAGLRGPGPTEEDGVYVVATAANVPMETWRLFPTPAKVATTPFLPSGRQAMRLGPNAWLVSSNHQYSLMTRADGAAPWVEAHPAAEEIEGVYLSPRLDRATFSVDLISGGLPVFTSTGATAYTVTQLQRIYGVGFSADGEQLALAGGTSGVPTYGVRLLRASDGVLLGEAPLNREPFAVAIDPVRPLLYVGVGNPDGLPSVRVYERPSLRLIGEMKAPATEPPCYIGSCYKGVIALSSQNALHVLWSFDGPTRAYRFTLPSGSGLP